MTAWVLPDHIADVLPSEARHIENLRRELLDTARAYGYELVMPPLLEHLESLLTGTGEALNLQTFKLVDQLSGRMLGVRADTTPQVARIDAHLLGRKGVTRLCYCGPVLHTVPERPHASREPLQFGAEIYGHAGNEADLEILQLALDALTTAGLPHGHLDLAHARIVPAILAGGLLFQDDIEAIHSALAAKDTSRLQTVAPALSAAQRQALLALVRLYGDISVLDEAAQALAAWPQALAALDELRTMADALHSHSSAITVTFDLADSRGYAYYSGVRFAVYAKGVSDAVLRGGRYDGVGAVFDHQGDRHRPAVGFSLDLKTLAAACQPRPLRAAIRAPWHGGQLDLQTAIQALRQRGETVVCTLPGPAAEIDEFLCDRELVHIAGQWVVQAI